MRKIHRVPCILGISAILVGSVAGTASAVPRGFISVCKQAAAGSGVTGTFTFTVVDPPDPTGRQVQVPVGGCSDPIEIARPSRAGITITETQGNGGFVSKIDVANGTTINPPTKSSPTITVADDVSVNSFRRPIMSGDPGTITFTNDTIHPAGGGPGTGGVGPGVPEAGCPANFWAMDLKTGQQLGALSPGSGIVPGTAINGLGQAVVRLDFNPTLGIKCTQANIVVEYEGTPTGWTVNIGDSPTNDGYGGGVPGTTKACAEVQVVNSTVSAFKDCPPPASAGPLALLPKPNPLSLKDGALKFVVRDQYLSVGQPFATPATVDLPHSFHIPDTIGPAADGSKIYAAFNRVIFGPDDRVGTGARRVVITMQ